MTSAVISFLGAMCFATMGYAQVSGANQDMFPVASENLPGVIVTPVSGAWELHCLTENPALCDIVQIVKNTDGSPVVEVRVLKLPDNGPAAAGITVLAPLGTLLPELLTIQIDDLDPRRYNFAWCELDGCIARFGMTAVDVDSLKAGKNATMRLVSILAPDDPLFLTMPLDGFTAAWNELSAGDTAAQ